MPKTPIDWYTLLIDIATVGAIGGLGYMTYVTTCVALYG